MDEEHKYVGILIVSNDGIYEQCLLFLFFFFFLFSFFFFIAEVDFQNP